MQRRFFLRFSVATTGALLALIVLFNMLVVAGSDSRSLYTSTTGWGDVHAISQDSITSSLTITNSQTYTAGLTVTQGLTVTGELTVTQGLTVSGGLHISGTLIVTGGLTIAPWDDLIISNTETITGGLIVTEVRTFPQGLTVSGDLTVTGALTVVGGLQVGNGVTVHGQLLVVQDSPDHHSHIYLPMISRYLIDHANNWNFESGSAMWEQYSTHNQPLIRSLPTLGVPAFSGQWAAQLGSRDDEISMISQGVSIRPENACLSYWQWTVSNDTCKADYGGVGINGKWVEVNSLCAGTSTARWVRHQVSLTPYSTAVTSSVTVLNFAVVNDYSIPSTLYVDDISFLPTASCTLIPPETAQAFAEQESIRDSLIGQPIHGQGELASPAFPKKETHSEGN